MNYFIITWGDNAQWAEISNMVSNLKNEKFQFSGRWVFSMTLR